LARVRLAPFTAAHVTEAYLAWLNDRRLMRYSRQRLRQHTRETSLAYLAGFAGGANKYWAVERVEDGALVGTMTAFVDAHQGTGDLGILVGVPGQGYGTEAWRLGLRQGFETLGLRKMTGGAVAPNAAMIRIFQRCGMVLEGTRRRQEMLDDGPADVLLYGLLREEWK
jgi:RimJ/RimL family protein N-acetyltransferase